MNTEKSAQYVRDLAGALSALKAEVDDYTIPLIEDLAEALAAAERRIEDLETQVADLEAARDAANLEMP